VIGGGPAGVSASIYLKRAGFDLSLFEKNEIGGLLLNAHLVENYPGFPDGIKGKLLCNLLKKHLDNWSIVPMLGEVNKIRLNNDKFIVETDDKKLEYKSVIIATGTNYKEMDIPIRKQLIGTKVFYEVKNLSSKIKHGDVCTVIGGGDAAFDYSLNLAEKGCKINIVFRSNKPSCLPLLEKRVKKYSDIQLFPSLIPKDIYEEKEKTVLLSSNNKKPIDSLPSDKKNSDYILIACGRKPNDKLLTKYFENNNIPGLYVAGDVRTGRFRQAGIAVGEGIHAAMSVEAYLRGLTK
jgi:thioredoxin reductase (NADPH)